MPPGKLASWRMVKQQAVNVVNAASYTLPSVNGFFAESKAIARKSH